MQRPRGAPVRSANYEDEETLSRLRPLARRRLRTSRPFFVLMRTRKPCVRRRRRRLGWNVRFMISGSPLLRNNYEETHILANRLAQCQSKVGDLAAGLSRLHPCVTFTFPPRSLIRRFWRFRRGSPRSFPQLWKKMWKNQRFRPCLSHAAVCGAAFRQAKAEETCDIAVCRVSSA